MELVRTKRDGSTPPEARRRRLRRADGKRLHRAKRPAAEGSAVARLLPNRCNIQKSSAEAVARNGAEQHQQKEIEWSEGAAEGIHAAATQERQNEFPETAPGGTEKRACRGRPRNGRKEIDSSPARGTSSRKNGESISERKWSGPCRQRRAHNKLKATPIRAQCNGSDGIEDEQRSD